MTLHPGARLGPYEILSQIGAGGMGEVYRARDEKLGRDVAVKVLPEMLAANADSLSRFEREARAVAALSHPNILSIFDVGREEGVAFAVMELLDGETLRERLSAGALPTRKALEYGAQLARGLAAAHEKGIVHRDLKPENVFLTGDGRVKILDFGLAKVAVLEPDQTKSPTVAAATEPGTVMGTAGYMSPEQVRGKPADQRSDIFSFGSILFEMLTGDRAFRGDSAAETMQLSAIPVADGRKPVTLVPRSQKDFGVSVRFSPDGRWVAYDYDESGRPEVYVVSFPEGRGKVQVSTAGGIAPRWTRGGKEIVYQGFDDRIIAVDVDTTQGVRTGTPRPLFELPEGTGGLWDVTADGERFLVGVPVVQSSSVVLDLITNWPAALKK